MWIRWAVALVVSHSDARILSHTGKVDLGFVCVRTVQRDHRRRSTRRTRSPCVRIMVVQSLFDGCSRRAVKPSRGATGE